MSGGSPVGAASEGSGARTGFGEGCGRDIRVPLGILRTISLCRAEQVFFVAAEGEEQAQQQRWDEEGDGNHEGSFRDIVPCRVAHRPQDKRFWREEYPRAHMCRQRA